MNRPVAARGGNMQRPRIRAFPSSVNETFVNDTWQMLQTAITEILRKNNSGLSFEELYRNAYTLVLHKRGDILYNGLQSVVGDHLKSSVLQKVEDSINGNFLDTLNKVWNDHTTAMVMIRDILMYMDRVYVQQVRVDPVYNLGLKLFRDEIISHPDINAQLKATLLNMIALERAKEAIEWIDLKNACQMLLSLGFENRAYYEEQFENLFLQESTEHYRKMSEAFLESNSAPVYVRKVNECLEEERQRAERYLDSITEEKIIQVLKDELISRHLNAVVEMENSGMVKMITNEQINDLREMYVLFKLVPQGIQAMTRALSGHLRARGKDLVESPANNNPVQYIQNLLDLKDQFDKFLELSFDSDREFKRTIQDDFEFFFNINARSAENLALYIDDKLKKGRKALTDAEIERLLDKAMVLFKFLADKDKFEQYYKQNLAKRLLYDRSISDDAEKSMITKLKTECGCQFTSKLQRMLADVNLKNEITSQFRDSNESQNCIDTSVMVLTMGVWPMSQVLTFEIPAVIQRSIDQFTAFYQNRHNGRRLSFLLVSSRGELVSNCFAKRYTFVATVPQISILYQFNTATEYTMRQLEETLKMNQRHLLTALQVIIKAELLQVRSGTLEAGDARLALNDSFQNKKFKVDLTKVIGKSESKQESDEIQKAVEDDRRLVIQAAIVRIMKTRKNLKHQQLVSEVLSQLTSRFNPKIPSIKKSIDILIEREYLKRSANDYESLEYIA